MNENQPGLFANKPFGYLFASALISLAGDQLTLLALPWLALVLSGNPLVVGAVLALVAAPRTLFLLVGGALADRFRPVRMLTLARVLSCAVMVLLGAMLAAGALTIDALYVLALLLGTASAIGMPCGQAILGQVLPADKIKIGTAVLMSAAQMLALLGPVVAGLLLVFIGSKGGAGGSTAGFPYLFWFDALSFALSALMLTQVRCSPGASPATRFSLLGDVKEGFAAIRADSALFSYIVYVAIISFFVIGPVSVAVPVLVKGQASGNALQYGIFISVMGIGSLVAMALSPLIKVAPQRLMFVVVALDCAVGVLLIAFVNTHSAMALKMILFTVGMIGGYIQATLFPLVQSRVEQRYTARVMSILTFAYIGLVPVSAAIAGVMIKQLSLVTTLELMGAGVSLTALAFLFNRNLQRLPLSARANG